jgi:hypothetical protein
LSLIFQNGIIGVIQNKQDENNKIY